MAAFTKQYRFISLILSLYSISLMICCSNAEEFTKVLNIPDDVDLHMTDVEIRGDRGFLFATCDRNNSQEKSLPSRTPSEYECKLHLLTPSAEEKQCRVTFKAEGPRGISEIEMEPFGEKRLLFVVIEMGEDKTVYVRINTVDFESCTMYRFSYPNPLGFPRQDYVGLTIYPDKYELMLRDNTTCADLYQCKITFDPEGHQVGGPVAIPNEYLYMSQVPTMPGSLDKGHFSYGRLSTDDKWWGTMYVDEFGTGQVLATLEGEAGFEMYSNGRDLYAYCGTTDGATEMEQFWCMQYDWKTGKSVNLTFDGLGEERNLNASYFTVAFVNLGPGQFLFSIIECTEEDTKCERIHLATVDSNGKVVKSSYVPMNLTCPTPYARRSDMAETKDGFCLNFMCSNGSPYEATNRYIKFHNACIPKSQIE